MVAAGAMRGRTMLDHYLFWTTTVHMWARWNRNILCVFSKRFRIALYNKGFPFHGMEEVKGSNPFRSTKKPQRLTAVSTVSL